MSQEKSHPFDKKFDEMKARFAKFKLKPLRSTVHPRDSIFAVECLLCGEFWQPQKPPYHEKTCTNPHQNLSSEDILKIVYK